MRSIRLIYIICIFNHALITIHQYLLCLYHHTIVGQFTRANRHQIMVSQPKTYSQAEQYCQFMFGTGLASDCHDPNLLCNSGVQGACRFFVNGSDATTNLCQSCTVKDGIPALETVSCDYEMRFMCDSRS